MKNSGLRLFVVMTILATCGLGTAEARNPNCAGGIQYWVQAMADKGKGNFDDYRREITKAVQRLEMCVVEDTTDYEALGYLGQAYAEVDSPGPAGRAFAASIHKLAQKGDKKKVEQITSYRDHYWYLSFNEGVTNTQNGQEGYPDFAKAPADPADSVAKREASEKYQLALKSFTRASLVKPDDADTYRNLGTVYSIIGELDRAEHILQEGLKIAPSDSALLLTLRHTRVKRAVELMERGDFNDAVRMYDEFIKSDSSEQQMWVRRAEARFQLAQSFLDEERTIHFKAAGDDYVQAAAIKPNVDVLFNAANAYENADEFVLAEQALKAAQKIEPENTNVLRVLGSTLMELKKYDEAIKVLHRAVLLEPKNQVHHLLLGNAYTKAGNSDQGTAEVMVFLALKKGQTVDDAAVEAKKAAARTDAAKILASMGGPDQLNHWEGDGDQYATWFYWSKKQAFHFKDGVLVQQSDWSTANTKVRTRAK